MVNRPIFVALSLFAASSLMAKPEGVPPGPPAVEIAGTVDTNVVNTVDANVVNTVDTSVVNTVDTNVVNTTDSNVINTVNANLVNTVSGETLNGVSLGPATIGGAGVIFLNPAKLHAMSVSVASVNPGEICNVFVEMGSEPGDTTPEPIGLSVLSNGQADTVSATYEIPIAPVFSLNYRVDGTCTVSFSLSYEEQAGESDFARLAEGEPRVRIELR